MQIAADGPHHHLAAIQADRIWRGRPLVRCTSAASLSPMSHGQARSTPHGMIFMRDRRPEERHDAIAQTWFTVPRSGGPRHHQREDGVKNARASRITVRQYSMSS